ncbi:GTPase HflX [Dyadobacter frigoris]|uniref:GTPase HflX n=1 Tax=Dyadobacter frigoris TaxID=2576211 RepID=A0A4U6D2X6_9BACT|nr:GTPase HflX [Dyadobacter frigoris]TKT90685.1 GTPase HflX [Dyadobacter frigoris]GLU51159.1 GTPase HflX [Dyadobacter frigoris]
MRSRKQLFDNQPQQQKAVLVAVSTKKQNTYKTQEYLLELAFLAQTLEIQTMHSFIQKLEHADKRTYVGKGKLQKIAAYLVTSPVDMLICDDDLSPAQMRNLQSVLQDVKIMDRGILILEIFAMRAQSAQSKLAVELARYQYLYPRRLWTPISQQNAGAAATAGSGETELETNRRLVREKISFLKDKLKKVDIQSQTRSKERDALVRVTLVGYTNVGKSTLMRLLSKADVHVENKLFATIDSTVRQVQIHNVPFLLTDTVGFIRKLPPMLIESFKSTLDEMREADILLLIEDISNPSYAEHLEVVHKTLEQIGVLHTPTLLVFNKIDLYNNPNGATRQNADTSNTELSVIQFQKSYPNAHACDTVFISAEHNQNIGLLKDTLYSLILNKHMAIHPDWTNHDHDFPPSFQV